MSIIQGDSEIIPLPVAFRDDAELRDYLGIPVTAEGRALVARITSDQRRCCAEMRAFERELLAGRIPRGAIAFSRGRR